jgi:hypothetical protein
MTDALRSAIRQLRRVRRRRAKLYSVSPRDEFRFRDVAGPIHRRDNQLRHRIERFLDAKHGLKKLHFKLGDPMWRPVSDPGVVALHASRNPECFGRLRVTPGSGPGWEVFLCDVCGMHVER